MARKKRVTAITAEVAAPPTSDKIEWNVNDLSYGYNAQSLTPEDLAMMLRQAENGQMVRYLAFFDEMIARDPHLQALVSSSLDYLLQATFAILAYPSMLRRESQKASPEAKRAQLIADIVEEEFRRPEVRIDLAIRALGMGFAKGVSGVKVLVAPGEGQEFEGRKLERLTLLEEIPGQRFGFDRDTGEITISLDGSLEESKQKTLSQLGPYVCALVADQGVVNPARRGYLRSVMSHWLIRNLGFGWWARFTELYGVPFRQGIYRKGDRDSQAALAAILKSAGNAGYAVLPEGSRVEIVDTFQRISGHSPHQGIAEYSGREMSKVILGHAHAIEVQQGTGSVQGSKASDMIAVRKTNARGLQIAQCLREQIVWPFVARNFGVEDAMKYTPEVQIVLEQRESLTIIADAMDKLVKAGMRSIPVIEVHKLTGVRIAEPGEAVLEPIPMPGQPKPGDVGQSNNANEPVSKPLDDPAGNSDTMPDPAAPDEEDLD